MGVKFYIESTSYDRKPLNEQYPCLDKYHYEDAVNIYGWHHGYIIVNSLEELLNLNKELGEDLIINVDPDHEGYPFLEIYDGYRE